MEVVKTYLVEDFSLTELYLTIDNKWFLNKQLGNGNGSFYNDLREITEKEAKRLIRKTK